MPTIYNKVEVDGVTYLDLSQDTVSSASHIRQGFTGHLNDGTQVAGAYAADGDYIRTVICDTQTFTVPSGQDYYMPLNNTARLVDGDEYIVTYDNVEYVCSCRELWGSDRFIGDLVLTWGNLQNDYIFPFCIEDWDSNTNLAVWARDKSQHSIKIEHLERLTTGTTLVTKSIVTNGTYNPVSDNADGYSSVTVNVPSVQPTIQSLTVNPSTSQQSFNASGVDGYKPVTVNAMPTGTAGTPTATKGSVSNHSVTVTPSVTNTTGYITGSTINGTAVSVSASELVSGSQTITENGTVDVTNLASIVVDVQGGGGGGSGMQVDTKTATPSTTGTLSFTGLKGSPTSFYIVSTNDIATSSTKHVASIVYDGATFHGQSISNTNNAQVSYLSSGAFMPQYSNGTLDVGVSGAEYSTGNTYKLVYTYGGSASDIGTVDVQVGSGATSITFTGLSDEPDYFSVIFKSDFSTSSGYQRVIAVGNDGTSTYGMEMDSSAKYSAAHWSYSYNNGSLTVTSQGTNAGGYFHQPGYYQLTYAVGGEASPYQKINKTYTPTTSTQTEKIEADAGYDAIGEVNVTVNPIPSTYVQPTSTVGATTYRASTSNQTIASGTYHSGAGTIAAVTQTNLSAENIKSGTTVTISNGQSNLWSVTGTYSGGGSSVQTDVKTVTASNYPTSLSFTGMQGEPKMFTVRLNTSVSSSGSTTYYYIVDITSYGSSTVHGNVFRIGNTRQVSSITSGYSWSYSGTTLTITSSAASRSASPGAFYSGSYELMYVY